MRKQPFSSHDPKFSFILIFILLFSSLPLVEAKAQPVTASGNGLYAEYFNLDGSPFLFNGVPLVVNGEGPLDHRWDIFCGPANLESYYQGVCARWAGAFSANGTRFQEILTGYIEAPQTGSYVFYGNIDDFVEIALLGQTYTFNLPAGGPYALPPLNLTAGELYPISMKFMNQDGVARLNLYWTLPDGTQEIVPRKYLYTRLPNLPPTAKAGGPYAGLEGSPVTLDASGSSDPDNNIVEYAWDLDNNGSYETIGISPQVTFDDNGAFQVGLRVTDAYGESSTDSAGIVIANVLPVVTVLNIPATVNVGASFNVQANFDDPGLQDTFAATWDWGNGQTSPGTVSGRSVTGAYAYPAAGTFTLTLIVTDKDGGVGSRSVSIDVAQPIVYADAGPDRSAAEGEVISLDASGSSDPTGGVLTFAWDFDNDGLYDDASGVTPSVSFPDDGVYLIGLLVTSSTGSSATDEMIVTVTNVAPSVQLGKATVNASGNLSASGNFTDPGTDAWSGTVNYGDGSGIQPLTLNPDKTFSLAHIYSAVGVFTIEACINDDDGGTSCAQVNVEYTSNRPPVANAGGPYWVREGRTIRLNASNSYDPDGDRHLVYEWDLDGDGDFSDGSGRRVAFYGEDDAVQTIWLRVTDSKGASSIASTTVTIANTRPYIVNHYINRFTRVGAPIYPWVEFRDWGLFDTFSAVWDWGDGTQTEAEMIDYSAFGEHTYTRPGRYKITVTIYDDDGGSVTLTRWIFVYGGWRR